MPALEEKVDHLEQALALYLATDERIRRESEARQARFDAQFLAFQQKSERAEAQFLAMQQKGDKDRERADAQFLAMQQKADEDRAEAKAQFARADAQFKASDEKFQAWLKKADQEHREFKKQMAELSDSMGTIVEDMVAPNGERIAGQIFGDDPVESETQRLKRKKGGETLEIDLAVAGRRHVMVVEAKRRIRPENPDEFLLKLKRFKEFFPEYAHHQIVPVMASIYIEPSIIANLNKRKIYGLAFGDETFELVNLHQF